MVAISAIAFPAVAAFVTVSASSPLTAFANPIIASPNGISWAPKALISFSPVKNPITPPELGRVAAISASVLPAVAAFATNSPSIPAMAMEKSRIASPKGTSWVAKSLREDPPVSQEVNPFRISAAVRIRIVSANAFTPSSMEGLSCVAPSINGCTFVINAERSAPI